MAHFDYIPGSSKLAFFRDLLAVPDTKYDEAETDDAKLAKLHRRLSKLKAIAETIQSPGWKILEETMLTRVHDCDNEVWDTIFKADTAEAMRLAVERTGIVGLFDALNAVDGQIEEVVGLIKELTGDDPHEEIEERLDNA